MMMGQLQNINDMDLEKGRNFGEDGKMYSSAEAQITRNPDENRIGS